MLDLLTQACGGLHAYANQNVESEKIDMKMHE